MTKHISSRFGFKRHLAENGFTRTELVLEPADAMAGEAPAEASPLATFIHLSDLHVCDAKSPARIEFLDRYADPDYATREIIDYVGTYRPQEFLTLQVIEAMVQAANSIAVGPLLGAEVDGVLITGDVIDNGQANELEWYRQLMEGGPVSSASGQANLIEAAHGTHPAFTDDHYYKPDTTGSQRTIEKWGMVPVPGLEVAAQAEFVATGLTHPWYAIHGNHDAMLQGMVPPTDELNSLVTGSQKLSGVANGVDPREVFAEFSEVGPANYPSTELLTQTPVTQDSARRFVEMNDWVSSHTDCGHDHGLSVDQKVAYWTRDFGDVRVIALDTVNVWGGWQGCIDPQQFSWLTELLSQSIGKYVVLTSHHPLQDLFNGYAPEGEQKPHLKDEVANLLGAYPNVIAWISGHVHDHNISFQESQSGAWGFWQIRTGSHMDWPQQARVIEIAKTQDGRIAIGTQVFDHFGNSILSLPDLADLGAADLAEPRCLAGISRVLAANDWQRFAGSNSLEVLEGTPADRNAWLWLQDPFATA
ncbi:MAG: metallophosphoesterase [Actinomycetales bacterium]|nr:metallophosphoesterase [Actinomycetales bacterium]